MGYQDRRLAEVHIGEDKFWVRQLSKLKQDELERKYKVIRNSAKMMTLYNQLSKSEKAFNDKLISRKDYIEETRAIQDDIDKFSEELTIVKTYEIDGKKEDMLESTMYTAERLSLCVLVPVEDKDDDRELKSISWWLDQDSIITNLLSRSIDEIQMMGDKEDVSMIEHIISLFEEDVEPLPPQEIINRIMEYQNALSSGGIERKKSDSAYGVQIKRIQKA